MKQFSLILILFSLLVSPLYVFGQQSSFDVRGRVCDTLGKAVQGANVGLWRDSTLIAGGATNAQGDFSLIHVAQGEYRLEISCLGYAMVEDTIGVNAALTPLKLTMHENVEELEAVRVTASRTKVGADGTLTFRAQGAEVAVGRSTLEMLRFVPGVSVGSGEILVNGRSGTKIFIGDTRRTMTLQELRATPATEIERIVVDPQAGVEFGAGNDGGVVRVYLVPRSGLSGTLEASLAADGCGTRWDPRLYLTLRYQKNRFSMYHYLRYSPYFKYTTLYRYEHFNADDTIHSAYKQLRQEMAAGYNTGFSYDVAKGHNVSLYASADFNPLRLTMEDSIFGKSNTKWSSRSRTFGGGVAVEYEGDLPVGEASFCKLWASYSTARTHGFDIYYTVYQPDSVLDRYTNRYVEVAPSLSFKFGGGHNLQGGVYFDYVYDLAEKEGIAIPNFSLNEKPLRYNETGGDIRPWVQYSKSFFDKRFYLRLGVTGLYYWSDRRNLLDNETSYSLPQEWGVFPKLLMQFMLHREKQVYLQSSYSYFYSLPNYNYFSPAVVYVSTNQYSVGNRNLRMETFHSPELALFFLQDWRIVYRFRYCPNRIRVMSHTDAQNAGITYLRPENAGRFLSHYIAGYFSKRLFDFWSMSNAINLSYAREKSADRSESYYQVGGYTTHDFTFYKGIGMSIAFEGYMGSRHLNKHVGPMYALDAALYASFLDDQLQLNFQANNIVRNRAVVTTWYDSRTHMRTEMTRLMNFRLGVVWSFQRGKSVKNLEVQDLSAPGKEEIAL